MAGPCSRRALSLLAVVLLAVTLAACAGAHDQDLFGTPPPESADSAPTPPSASSDPPAPAPSGTTPSADTCTPELEPNDTSATATPFTTRLCGRIGSAGDIDYGSFVVPADAKVVSLTHTETGGSVSYRYFLGNVPVAVEQGELEALPGATYLVQIRLDRSGSAKGSLPSYELVVSFE